jgi:hypothetical protein
MVGVVTSKPVTFLVGLIIAVCGILVSNDIGALLFGVLLLKLDTM